ncbi:MAG TPA: UvrD-helicase domain-containing protein [Acidimicrobiales bacterium]|nr:UvrD-helicase domain-containing protein [Acidimicrobiales bacterium]
MTLVDAKERSRIREELDDTLFVEAGAGTGKTRALVDRVVNLVVEKGIRLRGIAAITFTEAAAAELRDRVREAFEKRLADASVVDAQRLACNQALADIDQAAIGTLHGFCLRILAEHPLEVDLPPAVDILDEVVSQLAFHERWSAFVDALYDDPAAEELVLRAWALGIEIDAASPMKASFKDVAAVFEDSWDRLDGLLSRPESNDLDPLSTIDVAPVRQAVDALVAMAGGCGAEDDLLLERCVATVAGATAALDDVDGLRQLRRLCEGSGSWRAGNRGRAANWPDVKAARAALDLVGERSSSLAATASDEVLRRLAVRLAHFTVDAAEQRRAVGHLVFHDLLVLARRLLRTSAEARSALHAKYDRLLLDEFQDTDPIQIEVAVLIAAAIESGEVDRPWQQIETEPGRLFFVGDPKQSIYRFRRADIGLFLAARDRFSVDGGGTVVLGQNFRTVPAVLEWVNEMFGALMRDEVAGSQPAYLPLTADRRSDPGADHRVVVLGGARDAKAWELRRQEATAVARTVATVQSSPEAWPVRVDDAWRTPRWRDVTILIPTRTSLRQLEDALDFVGVPYRVATGSLVFDTQEVREALDALRAIDDPGDELALASALRSPLYACSDVDLFTFFDAGGRWDLRRSPPATLADDHPVVAGMAHLRSLADDRWWLEPSALLDKLLRERNAFALAFGSRRPREVWRRMRFIVDQARAFEESAGGGGLRGFLAWADLQRTEGTRVHEPLMAETDDDAVSILTIHGAKGLEFPITVLSGMTTAARGSRPGPRVIWDGDVPEVKFNASTATDNFDRLADIEAEMDVYERLRLLYVGCTRARDHLVISAFHKPARSAASVSYGEQVATTSAGLASCRRVYESAESVDDGAEAAPIAPAVPTMPLTLPFDDREGWVANREALLEPHRRPQFLSATAIAGMAAGGVDAPERDDGQVDDDAGEADGTRSEIPWRRGRAGTAVGRAVHAVLQFVDPGADDIDASVRELATQQAHVEVVPDAVDTIVSLARAALAAPSVRAAHAAERRWRELYVAAPIGDRAVEGYIDLLYERPDGGLVLVDYKTDAIRSEADADAKVERYALQTAAYAVAVEVSTGLSVTEARLVFCRAAGAIERVVPDLDGAKARVRSLLGDERTPAAPPP